MSRGSLISPLVSELLAQVAKGDRITEEHVKRFLENPDRVMPDTFLNVEETFVGLLEKDAVQGVAEPDFDGVTFSSVIVAKDGKWVGKDGAKRYGPFRRIYGAEPSSVDRKLRSFGGERIIAGETPDGAWQMLRFTPDGATRSYPLPGAPVGQPVMIGDEPACVTFDSTGSSVIHGHTVYGPYWRVDHSSLFESDGKVGYVTQAGDDQKMSVCVAGEQLVFRDGYGKEVPEYREWDWISDLVCDDRSRSLAPYRLSFVALDGGEYRIFHHGRPLPGKWRACEGLAVDLAKDSETRERLVAILPYDGKQAIVEAECGPISCGWDDIWGLRFKREVVSFIGKRGDSVSVVTVFKGRGGDWREQIHGHYEMAWEPKIVHMNPVFVARKDGECFVVDGTRESKVRVAKRESIRWHGLANGTILQVVRDEELGTETLHFGERKSRSFDRIYGVRYKDHARIEFMAKRNRRLVRAWFYFI